MKSFTRVPLICNDSRKALLPAILAAVISLALPVIAAAQIIGATVSGTVLDQSGAPLPNASIELTHKSTGFLRSTTTDDSGHYSAAGLDPGNYDLKLTLTGFSPVDKSNVWLALGNDTRIDFAMQPANTFNQIDDTSPVSATQTSDAQVRSVIGERELAGLPLFARSFDSLAALQPGLTTFPWASTATRSRVVYTAGTQLAASGAPPRYTGFLLDGTQTFNHAGMNPAGVTGVNLGLETLAQVSVVSHNYSPEYGRSGSALISSVTRPGTREWHGTLFEFHNNDELNANRWENHAFGFSDEFLPEFVRNQFGGAIGGPILNQSWVLFASYEGLRERTETTFISVLPDAAARRGALGFGQPISIHPAVVPYLNALPLPNGRSFGSGFGEFFHTASVPTDQNFGSLRMDRQFANGHRLFGRIGIDDARQALPDFLPSNLTALSSRQIYSAIGYTEPIGSRLLNVARIAFNRTNPQLAPETDLPESLAFRPGRPWRISVPGLSAFGSTTAPLRYTQNVYELTDDLQWNRGAHTLRFGGQIEKIENNNYEDTSVDTFTFSNLASFLVGQPVLFSGAAPGANPSSGFRQWLTGVYFQDQWRLADSLTVNLGLRYEAVTVPKEAHGRQSNLLDVLRDNSVTVGASIENPSLRNFAPRAGIAWAPFASRRTVLRAGAGVYHNQIMGQLFTNQARTGFYNTVTVTTLGNPFPTPVIPPSALTGGIVNAFEPKPDTPTVYQWNAALEQQLPLGIVATAGYSGSHGSHWIRWVDANLAPHIVLNDGRVFFPNTNFIRTNPAFAAIRRILTDANADSHALELHVARRSARGISGQLSYTFLRAINETTGYDGAHAPNSAPLSMIPFDHTADRSRSNYEQRHVTRFNLSYALPFKSSHAIVNHLIGGWEAHSLGVVYSGLPFSARMAADTTRSLASSNAQRPNLVAGRSNDPVLTGSPDKWFDTSSFSAPLAGFYGTVGRNTITGPGFITFDLAVSKGFSLWRQQTLRFRVESYNLFNHVNFGIPDGFVFTTNNTLSFSAGRITQTVSPARQIQFSLRYSF